MDKVVLQLYRSLRRKSRLACKQKKHLLRFQVQPNPDIWGKYLQYDPSFDKKILESIFPASVHAFIENDIPFHPDKYSSIKANERLFAEYLPILSADPNLDPSVINRTINIYPTSDEQTIVDDEQKLQDKISSDPTMQSSTLTENMRISEYDNYRMSRMIFRIFSIYKSQETIDAINNERKEKYPLFSQSTLIEDGFAVLKALDEQIELNRNTSISEASGIRVIATSRYLPEQRNQDKYAYVYRIRIENHGKQWVQLLGRHWIIKDSNGRTDVLERFQPGVVGVQPPLESREIFIYGSGVHLTTGHGNMSGSLQFSNISGELFEVPINKFELNAIPL